MLTSQLFLEIKEIKGRRTLFLSVAAIGIIPIRTISIAVEFCMKFPEPPQEFGHLQSIIKIFDDFAIEIKSKIMQELKKYCHDSHLSLLHENDSHFI